jgi:hypothetical protein
MIAVAEVALVMYTARAINRDMVRAEVAASALLGRHDAWFRRFVYVTHYLYFDTYRGSPHVGGGSIHYNEDQGSRQRDGFSALLRMKFRALSSAVRAADS